MNFFSLFSFFKKKPYTPPVRPGIIIKECYNDGPLSYSIGSGGSGSGGSDGGCTGKVIGVAEIKIDGKDTLPLELSAIQKEFATGIRENQMWMIRGAHAKLTDLLHRIEGPHAK